MKAGRRAGEGRLKALSDMQQLFRDVRPRRQPDRLAELIKEIHKEQIRQIEAAGFDYVQIHGEIPETEAEAAKAIPILKAFNVSDMDSYEKYHNDSRIAGYVFDAIEPGSGKTFDWKLVDNIPRDEKLLLLAGGLNPDNVRMAIEAVHPDGVDVSSGVENDDKAGKNPEKIHDFVAAVKS